MKKNLNLCSDDSIAEKIRSIDEGFRGKGHMKESLPTKPIQLNYSFSDIGTVSATLHQESAALYAFLQSKGEIERLEQLDHLGKLRSVHKTAHYSRWEYIMLQMYFIDALKEAQETHGLSSKVQIGSQDVSSSEELIKCWILLLNASHLFGIFDTERSWMDLLLENQSIRNAFLSCLPSDSIRSFANESFAQQDFYSLHKYIGLIWLEGCKNKDRSGIHPIGLWIDMLEASIVKTEPGSKLELCRRYFTRVRQLVFVALDINHCPLGIRINPALLLNHIKQSPDQLLSDDDNPFLEHLHGLEQILFKNVYASRDVVSYRRQYIADQKRRYDNLVKKHGVDYFTKPFVRLSERLLQSKESDFGKMRLSDDHVHYLRLDFLPPSILPHSPVKYHDCETHLHSKTRLSNWPFVVTPTAYSRRSRCVVDAFAPRKAIRKDEVTVAWRMLEYIFNYYGEYKILDSEFYERMADESLTILFRHLLSRYLKPQYRIHFDRRTSPMDTLLIGVPSASGIPQMRRAIGMATKKSHLNSERKHELSVLKRVLKKEHRGSYLISTANIRIFNKDWEVIAELDGIYFRLQRRSLNATIIEAKSGTTIRSSDAKDALAEKITKALCCKNKPAIVKGKGYAYTKIEFCKELPPWQPSCV